MRDVVVRRFPLIVLVVSIFAFMPVQAGSPAQTDTADVILDSGPIYLPLVNLGGSSSQNSGQIAVGNELSDDSAWNPPPTQSCTSQYGNLDSALASVVCHTRNRQSLQLDQNTASSLSISENKVRVEMLLEDDVAIGEVLQRLADLQASNVVVNQRLIAANVPLSVLDTLADDSAVAFVNAALPPLSQNRQSPRGEYAGDGRDETDVTASNLRTLLTGEVVGQHVEAMRADVLQAPPYNLTGSGVRVGIISDSYDCYGLEGISPDAADTVAAGEIPDDVVVLREATYYGWNCEYGSDEMRGMMEIAADVAPEARYAVASAGLSKVDFAASIDALRSWGADLIITDYTYKSEAMFQDDIVTQAANRAYQNGIHFFTLSHNNRNYGWQGAWSDPDGDGWLNFADGDETLDFIPAYDGTMRHVIQWDTPFRSISGQRGSVDLWMGAYLKSDDSLIRSSDWNNRTGDPYEIVSIDVTGGEEYYLKVYSNNGTPGLYQLVQANVVRATYDSPPPNGPTIFGNGLAEGAITIAGRTWWSRQEIYLNTSHGVTPILFNQSGNRYNSPIYRVKPDVAAPTGLNNSFFGGGPYWRDGDEYTNFWGTSSSTPAAAGVAILLLESNPNMSPDTLANCLRNSAIDMTITGIGHDEITGYGALDAPRAFALCGSTINMPPSIIATGSQTNVVGESISLPIDVENLDNDTLTFSAVGLPSGLSINASTGLISGQATDAVSSNVTVSVLDDNGGQDTYRFNWTIIDNEQQCGGYGFEAEDGNLSGNFVVENDAEASNGQYIVVPDGVGNAGFGSQSKVTFCFTVVQPGSYRMIGHIFAPNGNSDSFFATVDSEPEDGYYWRLPMNDPYVPLYLADNTVVPLEFDFGVGEHQVVIYLRDDGSVLDKFYLEPIDDLFSNNLPAAVAGSNQTVTDADSNGSEQVILDGTSSSDSDGNIASYSWSGIPGVTIPSVASPVVDVPVGTYDVTLTVIDNNGAIATDSVTITVTEGVMLGNVNCDDQVDAVDALFILQYAVDIRIDAGNCPLSDTTSQLHAAAGDVNDDGEVNAIDALFIMQCAVDINNAFCPAAQSVVMRN